MAEALRFACDCGALRGEVRDATPAACTHIACHCRDCRAAYTHLGRVDPVAVGILQTTQDRVRVTQGWENLRVFRHTRHGALRWFAACCGAPTFFTPLRARLVHVGLNVDRLATPEAVGPVRARAFVPTRDGKSRHERAGRMVGPMAARMLERNLSGRWRGTPFFDAGGKPAIAPVVLTQEARAAALRALRR